MTHKPSKVLIIKTGYTETFTNEPFKEGEVSLGDVLRTTALLHLYKQDEVTWLTDKKAIDLLKNNSYISRLLEFNLTTVLQLQKESFDVVINLEKNPGLCALADSITAWHKMGYRLDAVKGVAEAYHGADNGLYLSTVDRGPEHKHWLHYLFKMLGHDWRGEDYILSTLQYSPTVKMYEIGLNHLVGTKFTEKSWSWNNWVILEKLCKRNGCRVSMQPKETTLHDYVRWIDSCELIVTNDSLGLHIAMALRKRIVGLFGPTPISDIHPYGKGIMLTGDNKNIGMLTPVKVMAAVIDLLGRTYDIND